MMTRISLASHGIAPLWWLESLPLREYVEWTNTLVDELNSIAAEVQED